MEHIDIELLQNVPVPHLQEILKARNISIKHTSSDHAPSSLFSPVEVAQMLFDRHALLKTLRSLDTFELQIVKELVACGGRANSRDLALYFATLASATESLPARPVAHQQEYSAANTTAPSSRSHTYAALSGMSLSTGSMPLQYPAPHPHGLFEQAIRHLLLLGLLFWGKQTAFAGSDYASGTHDGVLILPEAVRAVVLDEWGTNEPFTSIIKQASIEEHKDPTGNSEQSEESKNKNTLAEDAEYPEGMRLLQRSLYLYWSLVASQHDGLPIVSTGLLSRASLRHVIEQVGYR